MKRKQVASKDTTDVLAWLHSVIPDTPQMQAIADEENAKYDLAMALTKAREAAGHTQTSLAAELGVTQSLVSKWEKINHNHTLETVLALCRATGANLVMGLEVNGQLIPITKATERCVLLSQKTHQQLEQLAQASGLSAREVLLSPLAQTNPVVFESAYQTLSAVQ